MAIYFVSKDKRARAIVARFEVGRARLNFFLKNSLLVSNEKQKIMLLTSARTRRALTFSVKSRNRCVVTGRAGSVFRYFRMSRIMLKEMASRGLLTGVRKSSW